MDFNFWESASRVADVMIPLIALSFGVSLAVAVMRYFSKVIWDAIETTANNAEPLAINTDDFMRGFEKVFPSGKSKNDEKTKNDELADPFDPEPEYLSFEALLAEKPKRKPKNNDLG